MEIKRGTLLGPYEIMSAIGSGGMGEVYRATDTRLDRSVAIKVIPSHLTNRPELRERFEREARAVSALNHPNICTLYDVGRQDGVDFIVMEYIDGETLSARLARGPLPLADVLRYAIEIASALEKAHAHGIVHRDLKPGNIMLAKGGAKLLDFGLAKLERSQSSGVFQQSNMPTQAPELTAEGTILGTIQYMAPEQLEGKDADERSDIFAFGAVLYEMVTGKKAFEGKSQVSLMAAIIHVDPPSMTALVPASPQTLDNIIRGCLAKNPDERWRSFHDVLMNLRWVNPANISIPAQTVAQPRKMKLHLAWLAVALTVAAAAGMAAYVMKPAPSVDVLRFTFLAPPGTSFRSLANINGTTATADPWPSVSPDGKTLAFAARGADSKTMIWIRRLNTLVPQMLSGTENGILPFWSPDGKYLGFFAEGKLKKVSAAGGPPQALCDAPVQGGISGSWSKDDTILFVYQNTIHRVAAAGGQPAQVTTLDTSRQENVHNRPYFLPDGRHFVFNITSPKTENQGIYLGSLDSKEKKQLLNVPSEAKYSAGYLVYQRAGVLSAQRLDLKSFALAGDPFPIVEGIAAANATGNTGNGVAAFSVSSSGALAYRTGSPPKDRLSWFDRSGKPVRTLGEDADYSSMDLSPDGKTLAVERAEGADDIWLLDSVRGTVSRLTFDPAREGVPSWTPDGKKIFFFSTRSGLPQIFQKNSDGTGQDETVLKTANPSIPLHVSRDGRYLLYREIDPKTKSDLWLLPLTGERKPRPLLQTSFDELNGDISPDSRWIAYQSNESGRYEIYVQPLEGSTGRWQISNTNGGGLTPLWNPNGKELFYLTNTGDLMIADISNGNTFQSGIPRKLFTVPAPNMAPLRTYSITPDGQRFIFNTLVDDRNTWEITVVTNWLADVKK